MIQPLGVILAGGQATRMGGGDKGALPLGSSTLLSHVIDRLTPQAVSYTHLTLPTIYSV